MKSRVIYGWVLCLIGFVGLNLSLISCGDTAPTPVAKPKEEPKPKPKPEVKEVELKGIVEKMETDKDKPVVYHLKSADSKLVVLFNKIDGKDVDLEQYVGKEVILKGKASVTLKKTVSGEEFKSTHLREIYSIEAKDASKETTDKPAETKSETEPKKGN